MLREQFVVHARLVIKTVEKTGGNELNQVAVTLVVLAQKDEMIRALGCRATIFVIVRRDVDFAADDRLHAVRCRLVVEIRGGEKIAVIRHRDGGHSAARGFGGQLADFAGAVEKRVVRVKVQMNEI